MRWFWRKHKRETEQVAELRRELASREAEAERVARRMRLRVEHNNIAESIAASFKRRGNGASAH